MIIGRLIPGKGADDKFMEPLPGRMFPYPGVNKEEYAKCNRIRYYLKWAVSARARVEMTDLLSAAERIGLPHAKAGKTAQEIREFVHSQPAEFLR